MDGASDRYISNKGNRTRCNSNVTVNVSPWSYTTLHVPVIHIIRNKSQTDIKLSRTLLFGILNTQRVYFAVKYDLRRSNAFVIIRQNWFMHQQPARAALSERLRLWLNSFQNELKLLWKIEFASSYSVNNAVLPVHCRENVLHGVIPIAGSEEPSIHTRNYAKWRRVCYSRSHPNTAETPPNRRAYSERPEWLILKVHQKQ